MYSSLIVKVNFLHLFETKTELIMYTECKHNIECE